MPNTDCPSATDLIAFHLGNLPESRQDDIAEHVEGCAACERRLDELDGVSDDALDAVRATATGPPAVVAPVVLTGKRVGDYEVLEEIGRGGMGLVCRARHGRLRRVVALKMLLSGEFASADYRARFLAESVAVARLRHPNIVQIYEVGEAATDGGATVPFLALEFVEGGSLAERVGERPQPPKLAAGWVETLALATQHAHEQGVIHRDLKPSNVLMTADGQPKVCDFGVAKVLAGPDLRTRTGLLVGTPEYMAPEQAAGQARLVSPASDVWALGAILYSLLTGRPPFAAPEPLSVLRLVQEADPLPPRRLQPSVPRDLETVCLRCLHKDPRRRYATARELADDLARFRQGRSVLARPTGTIEQGWKWLRRRPGAAALLLSLTLLLTVGLPLVTVLWLQAESARRRADASLGEAEASLYFNQVALAQQGMENGDASQARLMLRRCVPDEGRPDRRGLEWRYLQRQAYPGLFPSMWRRDAQAEQWVHEVSWSPDGKRLASAVGLSPSDMLSRTTPGEVRVWDGATGACEARLTPHTGSVLTVAWHPDGRSFVTGGADGKVFRWDITQLPPTPERLAIPIESGDTVNGLRYSPDGKQLAVGTGRALILWNAPAGRALATFPGGLWGARTLGFHAGGSDGKRLFLLAGQAGPNNEAPLRRWDVTGPGAPVAQVVAGPPTPSNCAAVGGGFLVLARDRSSELEVWDADGTQLRERLREHQAQVMNVSVSGGTLASAGDDGTVRLWDLATGKRTAMLRGHVRGVLSVAFSPDGSRLASGDKYGFVCIWDATRDPRGAHFAGTQIGGGEYLGALAFADGGETVVTVSQMDNRAFLYDLAAGRRTAGPSLPLSQSAFNPRRDQALSPDGTRLLAPDPATPTTAKVWDVKTGNVLASLAGHESKVILVAWSGDGRALATVAVTDDAKPPSRFSLRLWDAEAGTETARWPIEDGLVTSLALSRDGGLVAAARRERDLSQRLAASAVLVYGRDGKELHRLEGGVGVFAAIAFRPDGGQLAAAGYHAGRVYTWDLGPSRRFASRDSLTVPTSVAYSPDGERLAAGCFDNRVRLWE